MRKPRLLILIVAYNAETTITKVLARVPHQLAEEYDVEVLVLDDSSQDRTFEQSREVQRDGALPFPLHVLFNPVNQGYGGNQKIGYHFAIEQRLRLRRAGPRRRSVRAGVPAGSGAAAARRRGRRGVRVADAREGRRAARRHAALQVRRQPDPERVPEPHARAPRSASSTPAIASIRSPRSEKIPFPLNTNDFHFDTEIIIQFDARRHADQGAADSDLLRRRDLSRERPQVRVGRDEGGDGGPVAAAGSVLRPPLRLRAARPPRTRTTSRSSTTRARTPRRSSWFRAGSRVLDLGCAGGYVGAMLRRRKRLPRDRRRQVSARARAWNWMRSCCTISTTASRR